MSKRKPLSPRMKRVFKAKAKCKGRSLKNRYVPGEVQIRKVGDPPPAEAPPPPVNKAKRVARPDDWTGLDP